MQDYSLLLEKLTRYKRIFGNCQVPHPWPQDPMLSDWVASLRTSREQLPSPLSDALNQLDFDWTTTPEPDFHDARWQAQYNQLVDFYRQYGHCRVPSGWQENKSLAKWVSRQRSNQSSLSAERKALLEEIGFVWKENIEAERAASWNSKFEQLHQFAQENGHFQVPSIDPAWRALRIWLDKQRQNKESLAADRTARLNEIGFPWQEDIVEQRMESWESMYEKLLAFRKIHGHSRVPSKWKEDRSLAAWVLRQRLGQDRLSTEQKELLDKIGFVWQKNIRRLKEKQWDTFYEQLVAFKEQQGHCRVPDQYKENPALGKWVSWQRLMQREGKLADRRKKRLDAIEFVWADELNREKRLRWERMYLRLKRFHQKFGHCRVPEGYEKDEKLAIWVGMLRQYAHRLSDEQREKLNALNFAWGRELQFERDEKWSTMYEKLVVFQQENGHCRVTINHEDEKLFRWVAKQRRTQAKLSPQRLEKLNAIGFSWKEDSLKAKENKWETMYEQLEEYKARFGHCRVPDRWPENKKLANWVSHQRRKREQLPDNRKEKLVDIGFFQ